MVINIKNSSGFKNYFKNELKSLVKYVLENESRSNRIFKKFLKKIPLSKCEVNLFLVNDSQIKKYNKKFFNHNSSTDVISFSMIENEIMPNNNIIGDIIISLSTIKKNSKLYKTSFKDELFLVVIHGILHILGYEHKNEKSIMRIKEKRYLKNFLNNVLKR